MMGLPAKESTTGERMGLYKKGLTGGPPRESYNPLTAEYKVDQREVANDSMMEQYNNDGQYVNKTSKRDLAKGIVKSVV